MSRVALLCGVEAVNDKAYFEEHVKKICETREKTKESIGGAWFFLSQELSVKLYLCSTQEHARKGDFCSIKG